jgi:hypothetical protein
MGLDVAIYGRPSPVACSPGCENDDHIDLSPTRAFPRHFEGLPTGHFTALSKMRFRAGSYSGYGDWRDWLSSTFLRAKPLAVWEHPDQFADRPFYWLVDFSDCDGTIGPVVCRKLAVDFRVNLERAMQEATDDWRMTLYCRFMAGFELASDGGFAQWH